MYNIYKNAIVPFLLIAKIINNPNIQKEFVGLFLVFKKNKEFLCMLAKRNNCMLLNVKNRQKTNCKDTSKS